MKINGFYILTIVSALYEMNKKFLTYVYTGWSVSL